MGPVEVKQGRARRVEDESLTTSGARFLADIDVDGTWHCAFVRSTAPHALLTVRVPDLPAGAVVITAADVGDQKVPAIHGHTSVPPHLAEWSGLQQADVRQPLLASERVLFVGQPVAMVVAEDRYVAEDVAETVEVSYDDLPVVVNASDAMASGAVQLNENTPGNRSVEFRLEARKPDGEAPESLQSVEGAFFFGRQTGAPMENRGILVVPESGAQRLVVWANSQIPHALRDAIAQVLGLQPSQVQVRIPAVGGSFGTKGTVSAEEMLVAWAAARLARPLRWLEDRYESLCSSIQARDQLHHVQLAADSEGRFHSLKDEFTVDVGAYDPFGRSVPYNAAAHVPGPYRIPKLLISGTSVLTNKTPAAPCRGSGRPEAHFARERAVDRLARHLEIDPLSLRERNLVVASDMPYDTGLLYRDGVPLVYDGFDISACLRVARREVGGSPTSGAAREGVRTGRGVACYVASSGMGPYETSSISVDDEGIFTVRTGATSQGQSHATTFTKLAAQALGVPLESVVLAEPDTDLLQDGWGTMASRSAVAAGNAISVAARRLEAQLDDLAAGLGTGDLEERGESAEWRRGRTLRELVKLARHRGRADALRAEGVFRPPTITWGCGVHVATVEVDLGLRMVRVVDYLATYDHGPLIDPFVVKGQMIGGIAHGIGGALCEEVLYGADGQPASLTLTDYVVPSAQMLPAPRVFQAAASPSPANPLGLRGLGEAGTVAPAAAIANAVEDALWSLGVKIDCVPLTYKRLHEQLAVAGL